MGFPSPWSRKVYVRERTTRKKSYKEMCRGLLNPLDAEVKTAVALALICWGI